MKYRRLSIEELASLEKEFILYLASHQISSTEWRHMKDEKPGLVDLHIEQFSDLVFEKTLSNIKHLQVLQVDSIAVFRYGSEYADFRSISLVEKDADIDLRNQDLRELHRTNTSLKWTVKSSRKKIGSDTNGEKYKLLESGAFILKDSEWFDYLEGLSLAS